MSRLALITYLDGRDQVDPGYGVSAPPLYPGHGLPSAPVYPGNALPGGGHISLLPVFPFDPTIDNTLPPSGGTKPVEPNPPEAGNELPRPGKRYVVKWLACHGLILVPDNSLPETPVAEPK